MILKLDLISSSFQSKLIKAIKINILGLCFTLISTSFLFLFFNVHNVEAFVIENDKLVDKISKDYTKKICNSIAFGLSKESSMKFANKENYLIFHKKKGFDDLNKELIANTIATSVVETCGYSLSLNGEEGINRFKEDYISMNSSDFNYNLVE